jgi:FMN phosphatase YigB (HAD superfamily)
MADDGSLEALAVLPFVLEVLGKLKRIRAGEAKVRLGVISNTGVETREKMLALMTKAGLLDVFELQLLLFSSVEGIDKSQRRFFQLAAQLADAPERHCVYVSESDSEREVAEFSWISYVVSSIARFSRD